MHTTHGIDIKKLNRKSFILEYTFFITYTPTKPEHVPIIKKSVDVEKVLPTVIACVNVSNKKNIKQKITSVKVAVFASVTNNTKSATNDNGRKNSLTNSPVK